MFDRPASAVHAVAEGRSRLWARVSSRGRELAVGEGWEGSKLLGRCALRVASSLVRHLNLLGQALQRGEGKDLER